MKPYKRKEEILEKNNCMIIYDLKHKWTEEDIECEGYNLSSYLRHFLKSDNKKYTIIFKKT